MKKSIKRISAAILATVLMFNTSYSVAFSQDEANGKEEYREKEFVQESEIADWKLSVESQIEAYNNSQDEVEYKISWGQVKKQQSSVHKNKKGEEKKKNSNKYKDKKSAQAALAQAKKNGKKDPLNEKTYSELKEEKIYLGTSVHGEYVSPYFRSIPERDEALAIKLDELGNEGYTSLVPKIETRPSEDKFQINSLSKNDYGATSYVVPGGSYIVVKQAKWFFVWTPNDMSSHAAEFISYIAAADKSTDGADFKGMFTGFDRDIVINEKNSGTYRITVADDGRYILNVNSAERISHMDYGSYTPSVSSNPDTDTDPDNPQEENDGMGYGFTIEYMTPEYIYEYTFEETSQEYEWAQTFFQPFSLLKIEKDTPVTPPQQPDEKPTEPVEPDEELPPTQPEIPTDPQEPVLPPVNPDEETPTEPVDPPQQPDEVPPQEPDPQQPQEPQPPIEPESPEEPPVNPDTENPPAEPIQPPAPPQQPDETPDEGPIPPTEPQEPVDPQPPVTPETPEEPPVNPPQENPDETPTEPPVTDPDNDPQPNPPQEPDEEIPPTQPQTPPPTQQPPEQPKPQESNPVPQQPSDPSTQPILYIREENPHTGISFASANIGLLTLGVTSAAAALALKKKR